MSKKLLFVDSEEHKYDYFILYLNLFATFDTIMVT